MSGTDEPGGNGRRIVIEPLGDRALLARFPSEREAAGWVAAVRGMGIAGVTDVVLAYRSAAVFTDPDILEPDALQTRLAAVEPGEREAPSGKCLCIPVLYNGPDLDAVCRRLGLDVKAAVELHTSVCYDVYAIGFLQGFPYAGYLPDALSGLPRREEPRLQVPAGSVAVAGRQTGIYPRESPGGWHLLGRTPLRIADPDQGYFPIRAGDRIRFRAIDSSEFEARRDERL